MTFLVECWWVLAAAAGLGLGVAVATAAFARLAAGSGADDAAEPPEWERLPEDEKNFLRSWAKHAKQ